MDWGLVATAAVGLLLLVLVAIIAGELAARLFLEASEAPRDRRSPR